MDKFTFKNAGIYYSRIFNDVSVCWKQMDEIDTKIWEDAGRPSNFIAPSRQINIGKTLGM